MKNLKGLLIAASVALALGGCAPKGLSLAELALADLLVDLSVQEACQAGVTGLARNNTRLSQAGRRALEAACASGAGEAVVKAAYRKALGVS